MALPRISPRAYRRITFVALLSLAFIIVTGAGVRLTGSGLGCTEWPNCEPGQFHAPFSFHPMVEWVNRLITGLVSLAVIVAVLGSRDRSWGVRMVGERTAGAPGEAPQFYWLWAPISFDSRCTHFDVNETADGRRWHEEGFVVPVGGGEAMGVESVDYGIEWAPGTRRARRCSLRYEPHDGEPFTVELEPIYEFQMLGIGYLHPEWSHGVWKGELAVGSTRLTLPVQDPLALEHLHVQALCRARTSDGEEGIGILEQLVLGPHHPSGLTGFFDGAPEDPGE